MATKKTSDESDGHQTKILEVQATSFRSTFQASVDKIQLTHVKRFQTFPNVLVHIFGVVCFVFKPLPQSRTKMDATAAESMNLRTMPCNACRNATRNVMVAIHLKHERSFYGLTCALISKNLACAGKVAGGFVRHRA